MRVGLPWQRVQRKGVAAAWCVGEAPVAFSADSSKGCGLSYMYVCMFACVENCNVCMYVSFIVCMFVCLYVRVHLHEFLLDLSNGFSVAVPNGMYMFVISGVSYQRDPNPDKNTLIGKQCCTRRVESLTCRWFLSYLGRTTPEYVT